MSDARNDWKNALQPTEDCVSIERLAGDLTPAESEHVARCPRCQTELALWREFRDGNTSRDEKRDVEWISNELRRRMAPEASKVVSLASRRRLMQPRVLAVAATLMLAVAVGIFVQNREPSLNVPLNTDVYRSSRIKVISPRGEVSSAPAALSWEAIGGAENYAVELSEVDGTPLWRTTTAQTRVELPSGIVAQFAPGKTIVWKVTANRDARRVADSGTQKFRVTP